MTGRGSKAVKGTGVTVNLVVKSNLKDLQHIIGPYRNVSADIPWTEVFAKANLNPNNYCVKIDRGPSHGLLEAVNLLMHDFKVERSQYVVFLMKQRKSRSKKAPAAASPLPKKAKASGSGATKKRPAPAPPQPPRKTRGSPAKRSRFEEDEDEELQTEPVVPQDDADVYDFDDTASQASQDSQDDLVEAGIQIVDIKPRTLQIMNRNVTNVQMLRIRKELDILKKSGRWNKHRDRAPHSGNFLNDIFFG